MNEHNITLAVGATKVLHTAGTYCDRDIVVTAEKGDGYDNGYNEGLEAGKKAQYDAFWDGYQENGSRTHYGGAFAGTAWDDGRFRPKYPIKPVNADYMFAFSKITDLPAALEAAGVTLDISNTIQGIHLFREAATKRIGMLDFSKFDTTSFNAHFNGCTNLETIEKIILSDMFKSYSTDTFRKCSALKNIAFEGHINASITFADCLLLTNASVQSIVDALKDLTGATAQTLTFHADVGGKLTDEQKATITAKNWTLVY